MARDIPRTEMNDLFFRRCGIETSWIAPARELSVMEICEGDFSLDMMNEDDYLEQDASTRSFNRYLNEGG